MGVTHIKWEIRISVINSINFLSIHKSENVVFDNWTLGLSRCLRSSDVSSDGISESKDILKSLVLKGIWVYINQTIGISNSAVDKILPWFTWRVKVSVSKSRFDDFSTVDIFECGNLFPISFTVMDFQKFPTEHDFNSSFVAFVKSDFVGVTKFENFFIWSPVLNFRR
jgi:hypothetical protein